MGLFSVEAGNIEVVREQLRAPDPERSIQRIDAPRGRAFISMYDELRARDPNAVAFRLTKKVRGEAGVAQAGRWAAVAAVGEDVYRTVFPVQNKYVDLGEYASGEARLADVSAVNGAVSVEGSTRLEQEDLYLWAAASAINRFATGTSLDTEQEQSSNK